MKSSSGLICLCFAALIACDGPAIPGLMFDQEADAGDGIAPDSEAPADAGPESDDPLNPGGIPLDCAELTRCMATCSGSRCGPKCLQRADDRTQEIYSRISVCAANNDCRDPDCIQEHCTEEWLDCQENIHPDERPNCSTLRNCLRGCGDELDCQSECLSLAHQSIRQTIAEINACSEAAACIDEACRRAQCEDELSRCYSGSEASRMTCAELIICLEECGGSGPCQEDCRGQARALARTNLEALDNCRIACGPDPLACRALCPIEFARCDP